MASEVTGEIGSCRDLYGDDITIAVDGASVLIAFYTDDEVISMRLDAQSREEFQRLFMEAERQAEAHVPQ